MVSADFLFELGTEELPPKSLAALIRSLKTSLIQQLQDAALSHGKVCVYASPRRLAVTIEKIQLKQEDKEEMKRGPATSAPVNAAQGFARSCGVDLANLAIIDTDKGQYYQFQQQVSGAQTSTLLAAMVEQALGQLPISKRMRWGASRSEFVRPVQWFILMLGEELLDCSLFGLPNTAQTKGHRFHCKTPITIQSPATYAQQLRDEGHVIADMEDRKSLIKKQILDQARKINATAVISPALLDEVNGLVEWPVSLVGKFDDDFLAIPEQALISSMAEHQKYFHLTDSAGKVLPYFITVSNLISKQPEAVVTGNERVIRPRLADAAFFFEADMKTRLDSRLSALQSIVFQAQLGTLADKSQRIANLAEIIADSIGADAQLAKRAGELCKADLSTDMVLEFGDLQGIMGHAYALNDDEDVRVASTIEQHYWPKFAGDNLPTSLVASAVALADRLDTLVGLFGINQPPTGSKDPYALRRAAVGLLRIIIEQQLNLDLAILIDKAYNLHKHLKQGKAETSKQLYDFIIDRLKAYYDDQGISTEVYLSVHAKKLNSPLDFDKRMLAVSHFITLPSAAVLSEANKRVSNILAKNSPISHTINPDLLHEASEKLLFDSLNTVSAANKLALNNDDYQAVLVSLTQLAKPLEAFFANTMVIADDKALRENRLALLASIQAELGHVADISLLV